MNKYLVKVKHDKGHINFIVMASNEEAAKNIVVKAENCPLSAIKDCLNLQFYNRDGSLNSYGLACGYVEIKAKDNKIKKLFKEHNHFHVEHGQRGEFLQWETFDTLTQARKAFKQIKL